MTPNEFKAWFDGFTEAFDGKIPTKAQWGRIKDRVAEIDGKAYQRWYGYAPLSTLVAGTFGSTNSAANQYAAAAHGATSFNSTQAMADLGRAEAKSPGIKWQRNPGSPSPGRGAE